MALISSHASHANIEVAIAVNGVGQVAGGVAAVAAILDTTLAILACTSTRSRAGQLPSARPAIKEACLELRGPNISICNMTTFACH